MKNIKIIFLFSFFFLFTTIKSAPSKKDYLRVFTELSAFLYIEYGYKNSSPDIANNLEKVNSFDNYFRNSLKWNSKNINTANMMSDILLYGVVLGTLPIIPILSKRDYNTVILSSLEVLAINGIITDYIKILSKRQRPYSRFGGIKDSDDSHRSFYSGHTSTAFSIGVSTASILSKDYPQFRNRIWLTSLGLAAATGYFRVAGDKHYMTDILVGSIMGSLVGYTINNKIYGKKLEYSLSSQNNGFNIKYSF